LYKNERRFMERNRVVSSDETGLHNDFIAI